MADDHSENFSAAEAPILIARYVDEDATALETAHLSALLEQDSDHRQLLVDVAVQRVLLRKLYARQVEAAEPPATSSMIDLDEAAAPASSHDTMILPAITPDDAAADSSDLTEPAMSPSSAAPRSISTSRRTWVRPLLYAAAVLLPLICGVFVWQQLRHRPVGVLTALTDAQWEGTGPSLGQTLPPGRTLMLKSGVAMITLRDQVKLSIAGPAQVELSSANGVFLTVGKIVADVPHQVDGFTVSTQDAKVVDLGTEFGVSVNDAGLSEVHVLAGHVAVSGSADGSSQQIVAEGSACRVDQSGRNQPVPLDVSRFAFAARPDGPSPYDRWQAYGRELRRDPDLVAYYTFEKDADRPNLLINTAASQRASDGTIEGATWSQGRFPGKSCLTFSAADQRAKLTVPGQFGGLTLWAWVRVQGSPRPYNAIIAALDPDEKVAPDQLHHWSLLDDGRLGLACKTTKPTAAEQWNIWQSAEPPVDWRAGAWVLAACTIDRDAACFYCNGAPVGTPVTPITVAAGAPARAVTSVTPVTLGFQAGPRTMTVGEVQIGNFTEPKFDEFAPRNFHGSIDELGIMSRVMSGEEIKRLYEASKP